MVRPDGSAISAGDTAVPLPLASVTKPIVAYACLVAIEEGAISLDDAAGPPGSTVAHLLAHASGLDLDVDRVLSPPGVRRRYSNIGFEILATHLARRTAMPWEEYVRDAVTRPLGMAATTVAPPAGSGFASTVEDLSLFVAELLTPRLIDRSTLDRARSNQVGDLDGVVPGFGMQRPDPWGLGFEIRGTKSPHWTGRRNSPSTFGHFGRSGTFLWVDPVVRVSGVAEELRGPAVAGVGLVGLGDLAFGPWAAELWPAIGDEVLLGLTGLQERPAPQEPGR